MNAAIRRIAAFFVGILTLAYIAALVLGGIRPEARVDFATIVLATLCVVLIALLLSPGSSNVIGDTLSRVRNLQVASLRVELDALRVRQDDQSSRLAVLQLLAPLVLSKSEREHLLNLHRSQTANYEGNHEVRTQLRRLRYLNLISNSLPIGTLADGAKMDVGTIVQLTALGKKWAEQLVEMEEPHP